MKLRYFSHNDRKFFLLFCQKTYSKVVLQEFKVKYKTKKMKDKRHQRLDRYEHQHSSKEKIGDGFSALLAWRTALKKLQNYKQ